MLVSMSKKTGRRWIVSPLRCALYSKRQVGVRNRFMSQTSKGGRPPVKWLAPIQPNEKGSFGRPSLCVACRGNSDIGVVLNYFLFEASVEAEREKIDTTQVDFIRLHRTLD